MSLSEQERMDRMVLRTGELGALRFVIPDEIKPLLDDGHSLYHASKELPGAYIGGWGQNVSPRAMPNHKRTRLTREQALSYARLLDGMIDTQSHCGREWPQTFAAFVEAWYAALGRFLHIAQETAEKRASDLRAVKAAITGEV